MSLREAVLELSKDGGRTWTLLAQMSTSSMRVTIPEKEGKYHVRAAARVFEAAGHPVKWDQAKIPCVDRFFVRDPDGNRVEIQGRER